MSIDKQIFLKQLHQNNPHEPEFIQAVQSVSEYLIPYLNTREDLLHLKILERLIEPDRMIVFKITWTDDKSDIQVNKGYRVQMNSVLGPYKGGIRFHPSVNPSILKFLAFEQTLKNSLTGLSLGGAKGGADFDPRGRSDAEIMRFCQAYMSELSRHIGAELDVPAGDIGVSEREIGYMFGQYRKLKNEFNGVITGKGVNWGGSNIRKEATGYGLIYFLTMMLSGSQDSLEGKRVCISGAGNVARGAAYKAIELGATVLALSNIDGTIYYEHGFTKEIINSLEVFKSAGNTDLSTFAAAHEIDFLPGKKPWAIPCDIALPCATQNELNEEDALSLTNNNCYYVVEGANMPCDKAAIKVFHEKKIHYAPGKAANAGGVAVSGLEMAQNKLGYSWSAEKVDNMLQEIMKTIYDTCVFYGKDEEYINYEKGADIGGFVKVAEGMKAQGVL